MDNNQNDMNNDSGYKTNYNESSIITKSMNYDYKIESLRSKDDTYRRLIDLKKLYDENVIDADTFIEKRKQYVEAL